MTAAEMVAKYADIRKRLYGSARREIVPCRDVAWKAPPQKQPVARGVRPAWDIIVAEVCEKYEVEIEKIYSQLRHSNQVGKARREIWYRVRNEVTWCGGRPTYEMIAWRFERDHSSIVHGIKAYCRDNGLEVP